MSRRVDPFGEGDRKKETQSINVSKRVSTNRKVNRVRVKFLLFLFSNFPDRRFSRVSGKANFLEARERPKNGGDNGGQRNEKKGAKPVFDGPRSFRPFFPQSCLSIFSSLASQITEVPLPETERTRRRIARILLSPPLLPFSRGR